MVHVLDESDDFTKTSSGQNVKKHSKKRPPVFVFDSLRGKAVGLRERERYTPGYYAKNAFSKPVNTFAYYFILEMISSPRQARDKYIENSKGDTFFAGGGGAAGCVRAD